MRTHAGEQVQVTQRECVLAPRQLYRTHDRFSVGLFFLYLKVHAGKKLTYINNIRSRCRAALCSFITRYTAISISIALFQTDEPEPSVPAGLFSSTRHRSLFTLHSERNDFRMILMANC